MSESDETSKCMKSTTETLKAENANLSLQLDDEKRKVDDLQFAVEETGDEDTRTVCWCAVKKLLTHSRYSDREGCKADARVGIADPLGKFMQQDSHWQILDCIDAGGEDAAKSEEQIERQSAEVEDRKLRLSEEMDRVVFLERDVPAMSRWRRQRCCSSPASM